MIISYHEDYSELKKTALEARERSITWDKKPFPTKVGVAVQTKDGQIFGGYNIDAHSHVQNIHAEVLAMLKALDAGYRKATDFEAIVEAYEDSSAPGKIYPMCAYCRQFVWDFTHKDLVVIVINLEGKELFRGT